ncbi:MAG TPA: hypothetical protein VIU15_09085 [Streptomyces sp.]
MAGDFKGVDSVFEMYGWLFSEIGGIVFRIVGDKITDLDECVEDIGVGNAFWA